MGHTPELPLLPRSSARDGRGSATDCNANAEGKAQGKAKGETKTKAKTKAKPKAEVHGGEDIDASPMWGEPLVQGPRSDEPQEDSESLQEEGLAQPMHKPR